MNVREYRGIFGTDWYKTLTGIQRALVWVCFVVLIIILTSVLMAIFS